MQGRKQESMRLLFTRQPASLRWIAMTTPSQDLCQRNCIEYKSHIAIHAAQRGWSSILNVTACLAETAQNESSIDDALAHFLVATPPAPPQICTGKVDDWVREIAVRATSLC